MRTEAVDNKKPIINNILTSAVAGGAVAAGAEKLLLPAEVKAAIKNTRFGQDAFLKKMEKAAFKTMDKTGKQIGVGEVLKNAKAMYPEFVETAKVAKKSLAKTFLGMTAAIAGAKLLALAIVNAKAKKVQNQEQ